MAERRSISTGEFSGSHSSSHHQYYDNVGSFNLSHEVLKLVNKTKLTYNNVLYRFKWCIKDYSRSSPLERKITMRHHFWAFRPKNDLQNRT
jgi:hypothetical protein